MSDFEAEMQKEDEEIEIIKTKKKKSKKRKMLDELAGEGEGGLTALELIERNNAKKIKLEVSSELPANVEELRETVGEAEGAEKESTVKEEGEVDEKKPKKERKKNKDGEEYAEYQGRNRGMQNQKVLGSLSFDEAKQLIHSNPKCGMKAIRERRHVALSYHLIGGCVMKAINYITKSSIGKYRKEVKGVVVAIGPVQLASEPRVIDDHAVFHADVFVTQAVFTPVAGHRYECKITHISNTYATALVLDLITVQMPVDKLMREKLKGLTLEIDDTVEVLHESVTINRGLCQMRGQMTKVVKKGGGGIKKIKKDEGTDEGYEEDEESEAPRYTKPAAPKKTTFCETDSDSE